MIRTRAEIRKLQENWSADPCWDIETTEGFEEHRAELRAYREQMEAEWGGRREADLQALEARIGVPNRKLALAGVGVWGEWRKRKQV